MRYLSASAGLLLLACLVLLALGRPGFAQAEGVAPPQADLVEKGLYIARAANCVSCHTRADGQPFSGGVAFRTPYRFLGTLYSTNITPDVRTGIGRWSESQFEQAIRHGIRADGKRLFPALPYTHFAGISDEDVHALYAYLRSIPPVVSSPPPNGLLFSARWAMVIWDEIFFTAEPLHPDPAHDTTWNRGAYLVQVVGHCGACHTDRNVFLAERHDALTGGTHEYQVEDNKDRTWAAVNLTSTESGLAHWSVEDFQKYLKTGNNRHAGLFGPMNEVVINSLQYMSDSDIAAMATYLKSLPGQAPDNERRTLSSDEARVGQALYDKDCEECHLSSGRGAFLKAPPVAGSAVVQARNPSTLINVILYGAASDPGAPSPFGAWDSMKGFGDALSDQDVAALVTFLRASWDNHGDKVLPSDVARQR